MAGLPEIQFTVGGQRYITTMLDAVAGRGLYLKLLKAAAPALRGLADLAGRDKEAAYMGLAAAVLEGLDPALLDEACNIFAANTTMPSDNGRDRIPLAGVFGVHFAGKYFEMAQWLHECIKANKFLDFLSASLAHEKSGSASQ